MLITLLLATPDPYIGDQIQSLADESRYDLVVTTVHEAAEALTLLPVLSPDCLVVDLAFADSDWNPLLRKGVDSSATVALIDGGDARGLAGARAARCRAIFDKMDLFDPEVRRQLLKQMESSAFSGGADASSGNSAQTRSEEQTGGGERDGGGHDRSPGTKTPSTSRPAHREGKKSTDVQGGQTVLVVDDSKSTRFLIKNSLKGSGLTVVAEAQNGQEAVDLVHKEKPDLISMDLNMPVMDGRRAIQTIMEQQPTPILVVTSADDEKSAFDALTLGALDIFSKQRLNDETGRREFIQKAKALSQTRFPSQSGLSKNASTQQLTGNRAKESPRSSDQDPATRAGDHAGAEAPDHQAKAASASFFSAISAAAPSHVKVSDGPLPGIVAIASSTGGPKALVALLGQLPANFPLPIVIAQHINADFLQGLVEWLRRGTRLPVVVATQGMKPQPGRIHIASPANHLEVNKDKFFLRQRQSGDLFFPSCDRLLLSCARGYGADTVGVILTGMGQDGVKGIDAIFHQGGFTMAQDKNSAVVPSMPGSAIDAGIVRAVGTPQALGAQLNKQAGEMVKNYRRGQRSPTKRSGVEDNRP